MVTFASGNITYGDIQRLVSDTVMSKVDSLARKAECDIQIAIDEITFEPTIYVITDDRRISVKVDTETLFDSENGQDIGWGFAPRMRTQECVSVLNSAEDVQNMLDKYKKFLVVSQLCAAITMIEINPHEYFD